ncbi:hypothetical protein AUC68_04820 [Methyloceanibacter methanicus]|uniref:DNA methylase adenine-specific domain-containing protein n=1 Tax=Methyloceanibacter methanicus TaxID=1774968 RepID=A0A1E3W0H8_9HYPH|nr:restriction endonuclease subunit S [Methyloceanibacter methanicus]ODR99314.1 hypothetical protein AUC68_04820 [Methyloceanibacter methanicus]
MKADTVLSHFVLADALRGLRFDPVHAGTALSLMLLWSRLPAARLKGLPSFKDVSAEFVLAEPTKVAKTLCAENAEDVARLLAELRPGELESLRRALLDVLNTGQPVSEIAESVLQYCTPETWASKELSDRVLAILDAGKGARIQCAFSFVMRPAWNLSKQAHVDLSVEQKSLVPILSMLASACERTLQVSVKPISSLAAEPKGREAYDHALIFPPIGMRQKLETIGDYASTEALGARWGAHIGRWRSVVVVGNGLLFRTSSRDAAFKQELVYDDGLEAVVSLPRGAWPRSAMAVSALVFSDKDRLQNSKQSVRFIDASDPETLDNRTLSKLVAGDGRHPLSVDCTFAELSKSAFNLLVDRYVLDAESRRNRELLRNRETVRLSDIADVRRPQALPRGRKGALFEVREALLADIKNGRLDLPEKLSELPQSGAAKIESSILRSGDILLSIKGTIGKSTLVTAKVIAESKPVPVVPGQSFVIIRLRKGSAIGDPQVLLGYLRSPIAQSLLQGMAGGTTIANVAMGELKHLEVPIPSPEAQAQIVAEYDKLAKIQSEIDKLKEKMKNTEEHITNLAVGDN